MLLHKLLWKRLLVCTVVCAALAGCHDYKWQWSFQSPADMQRFEEQAREQQKLVFIFYKWYLDSDANRMHGDVLADNQVGALFGDTVNLLVDKASGPDYERYLNKYEVTSPPAFILVAPDGRYKVFTGYIPKDHFIELVSNAKAELMPQQSRSTPLKLLPLP